MLRRRSLVLLVVVCLVIFAAVDRPVQAAPRVLFFPETGQSITDEMLDYWRATPDPLFVLGYPLSAPFIQASFSEPGAWYRVQYFERAVLEEHMAADNRVHILGRLLGSEVIRGRQSETPFKPVVRSAATGTSWDTVTRHSLGNAPAPFKRFYDGFGGLAIFGRPLSEQFQERSPDTGEVYWVQYFERQRLEWHPEQTNPRFHILLGRLGDEYRLAHPDQIESQAFAPHTAAHAAPERMALGVNATLFYTDRQRALNLSETAGFGWVRQQIHWKDHQTADKQIAWGEIDAIVDAAQAHNTKLLFSVLQAPPWATGLPNTSGLPTRAALDDFARFLYAMAQRYQGRVGAYEIWNEINLQAENQIQPIPDPSYYVEMLAQAYDAIKAADPDAIVVSNSLAPTEWRGDQNVAVSDLKYFQQLFADIRFWSHVDVVGVHVFGCQNPPDTLWPDKPGPGPGFRNSREFYFRRVEDVRKLMVESGHGNRQMWITEFGWATANNTPGHEFGDQISFDQQAKYLTRAINMGRYEYAPWVGAMFVWNLNFAVTWGQAGNPQHQMASYGLLNPDWSPRPAYTAVQKLLNP